MTEREINDALKESGHIKEGESIRFVSLDDTIKFNCKRCGRCCSGRSDILLNPYDVYQIAKCLNISTTEVIKKYCIVSIGANSNIPIVLLKEDERGLCPFLNYSVEDLSFKCSINDYKPGVCIMHPIGAIRQVNKPEESENIVQYIEVPSCNVHDTSTEVKIKDFIKPYLDKGKYHNVGALQLKEVVKYIDTKRIGVLFEDEELKDIKLIQLYVDLVITSAYSYDTDRDFLEQIDEVKERIKKACFVIIAFCSMLGLDIATSNLSENDKQTEIEITKCLAHFGNELDALKSFRSK